MIKDCKNGRNVNIKERFLIVGKKIYGKESYVAFDTSKLKDYPPIVYYDRDDYYLGKVYDKGLYELEDIEDILLAYEDTCFSNHDLDDLRENLCKKRENFLKKILNSDL